MRRKAVVRASFPSKIPHRVLRIMKKNMSKKMRTICLNVLRNLIEGNPNSTILKVIVDPGTTYHICRSKESFASISTTTVLIKGVGGSGKGLVGVLKSCELGVNIPAIWYKDLPVEMLLSTAGLK